jgi:hypothetical protein
MSIPSVTGSRPIQSPSHRPALQDNAGAQLAPASGKVPARLPVVDPVSLSSGSVSLSKEALNARVAQLGDQTVDVAQRFIANVANILFGDAAKDATFSFSAISVAADTSLSAGVLHASGAAGSVDAAALRLDESASFIGRGQIVTADGQSFDFEVEVKYQASASAQSTQQAPAEQAPLSPPDTLALTGKELPAIEFPGSLADLFKVLGRQLEVSTDAGKSDGNSGNLSLRLIRLVNTAALLAPRAPQDSDRALASYSAPAASTTVITA